MNDRIAMAEPVVVPLRLPRLTRNEAQARSIVAQRAQGCEVHLGDVAARLSLQPLAALDAPAFGADDWRIQAEWAGAPIELRLPKLACEQWVRARFPQLDLPALGDELRAAALEGALEQALAGVLALQRGPVRITNEAASSPLAQRIGLVLQAGGETIEGVLATNSLGLMLIASLVAQRAPATGPVDEDQLPVPLRAEIGTTMLPAAQLRSLAVGDAILLDQAWIAQDGTLCLTAGEWALRVRHDDNGLVVTQPLQRMGLAMGNETETTAAPVAVDELPVRLAFDLGERTLSLGELRALQVGQTLELSRPLAQAVNIRANGALLGTGELVEVDGRLGVSITSLGAARG